MISFHKQAGHQSYCKETSRSISQSQRRGCGRHLAQFQWCSTIRSTLSRRCLSSLAASHTKAFQWSPCRRSADTCLQWEQDTYLPNRAWISHLVLGCSLWRYEATSPQETRMSRVSHTRPMHLKILVALGLHLRKSREEQRLGLCETSLPPVCRYSPSQLIDGDPYL